VGAGRSKLGHAYGACQFLLQVSLARLIFLGHGERCAPCGATAFEDTASLEDVWWPSRRGQLHEETSCPTNFRVRQISPIEAIRTVIGLGVQAIRVVFMCRAGLQGTARGNTYTCIFAAKWGGMQASRQLHNADARPATVTAPLSTLPLDKFGKPFAALQWS
jgi:hypothetical protein